MALAAGGHSSRDFLKFGTPMQLVLVSLCRVVCVWGLPHRQAHYWSTHPLRRGTACQRSTWRVPAAVPAAVPRSPPPASTCRPLAPGPQAVVSIASLILHDSWGLVWLVTGLVALVVFSVPQAVELLGWWRERKAAAAPGGKKHGEGGDAQQLQARAGTLPML